MAVRRDQLNGQVGNEKKPDQDGERQHRQHALRDRHGPNAPGKAGKTTATILPTQRQRPQRKLQQRQGGRHPQRRQSDLGGHSSVSLLCFSPDNRGGM